MPDVGMGKAGRFDQRNVLALRDTGRRCRAFGAIEYGGDHGGSSGFAMVYRDPADSIVSAADTGRCSCGQCPSPCATTLRITLGSASPASVAIGTQRMPSGARVRAGTLAV